MRFLALTMCVVVLLGGLSGRTQDKKQRERMCFVAGGDLADQSAPRFEQYPVGRSSPFPPAKLELQSNPIAKRYRTVIREEMTHGPNFAGHYRVVFWGCGTSCSQFAVVNLKTGHVTTLRGLYSVAYVDFFTDDFLPQTDSEATASDSRRTRIYWCSSARLSRTTPKNVGSRKEHRITF
jgi:hypothetical protein